MVPQSIEQGPGHSAFPFRSGRPFSRSPNFVLNTKGRAFRRLATPSIDLWAALVDEPMARRHECAMPIGKSFGSAYRPGAGAQGVVIVNARRQTVTSDPQLRCARSAYEDARISR